MSTVVDAIADEPGAGTLTVIGTDGVATALDWAGLHRRARQIATLLGDRGLRRGCRVGLLTDIGIDLIATLQAVWLVGGAVTVLPVPVRGAGCADQVDAIAADARLDLVVTEDLLADLAAGAVDAVPRLPVRPDAADLAVLQYTSGSTRVPRGVPVTHRHLLANLTGIRHALEHDRDHLGPMLSWLPLYHDLGLIGSLALPMWCGCSAVLLSPRVFARWPGAWVDAITTYRPTMSAGPNAAYRVLARLLRARPDADLSSLRRLIVGGEPVDPATMAAFLDAARARGLDPSALSPSYGLAEATLAVTVPARGSGLCLDEVDPVALEAAGCARPAPGRSLVRLGRPIPGMSVRIVDRRTGVRLGERRVGHIEVRGPSVVGHYWGEPPTPPGAWLRTGDLGYLAEGDLIVCGREKDVLFAAGRNIFPQDVEAAVAEVHPGCAVAFGVPGERLVVAVESTGEPDVVRRTVIAAVAREVGLTPVAVPVLPRHRLPRTSSGKLRRAETRRQYLAGELDTTERRPA